MKKLYYYAYCGEFGEVDAFFDENFKLYHYWDCNDACFRPEYMNPLFKGLGASVESVPKNKTKEAIKAIEKEIGY